MSEMRKLLIMAKIDIMLTRSKVYRIATNFKGGKPDIKFSTTSHIPIYS